MYFIIPSSVDPLTRRGQPREPAPRAGLSSFQTLFISSCKRVDLAISRTLDINFRMFEHHLHTCHILPPSEIDLGLCLAVFAGSGGKYLLHRIGWKSRIWQLWSHNRNHGRPRGPAPWAGLRPTAPRAGCVWYMRIYVYIYIYIDIYIYIYMYISLSVIYIYIYMYIHINYP